MPKVGCVRDLKLRPPYLEVDALPFELPGLIWSYKLFEFLSMLPISFAHTQIGRVSQALAGHICESFH